VHNILDFIKFTSSIESALTTFSDETELAKACSNTNMQPILAYGIILDSILESIANDMFSTMGIFDSLNANYKIIVETIGKQVAFIVPDHKAELLYSLCSLYFAVYAFRYEFSNQKISNDDEVAMKLFNGNCL